RATGRVEMTLAKRIPLGAGLGGGSSDAAAVLLALPALAGRALDLPELSNLAQQLGSDVAFFLLGGTAVGIGRGSELFPLPDSAALKKRLVRSGATLAMMTGSGSAVFGLFQDRNGVSRAIDSLSGEQTFRVSLVSRARYRSLWWRAMKEHTRPGIWPLQNQHVR